MSNNLDHINGRVDPQLQRAMVHSNFQRIRNDRRSMIYKDKTQQTVAILGKLATDDSHGLLTFAGGEKVLAADNTGVTTFSTGEVPAVKIDGNGIKVAQQGVDVNAATDDQLVMSSEFNMLKIVSSGTVTLTRAANATNASITVNHGLGVVPSVIAYADPGFATVRPLPVVEFQASGSLDRQIYITANNTDVVFNVSVTTSGNFFAFADSIPIKYFLFIETAN